MEGKYSAPSSLEVGLKGCCPRCGKGKLFRGFLNVTPSCSNCGLDLAFADSGDGPAVFIILLAGFVIVGLVLWVEFTWSPPYWVHALIWIPVTLAFTVGLIRPLKGWLVAQQFRHDASEGRQEK
jgi:uncharacterized protein (DUF983 family)